MKDYDRIISLYCPICGSTQFGVINSSDADYDDLAEAPDEIQLQCAECKQVFTKAELIENNQEIINANVEEIAQEVVEDFSKELMQAFKKWR